MNEHYTTYSYDANSEMIVVTVSTRTSTRKKPDNAKLITRQRWWTCVRLLCGVVYCHDVVVVSCHINNTYTLLHILIDLKTNTFSLIPIIANREIDLKVNLNELYMICSTLIGPLTSLALSWCSPLQLQYQRPSQVRSLVIFISFYSRYWYDRLYRDKLNEFSISVLHSRAG